MCAGVDRAEVQAALALVVAPTRIAQLQDHVQRALQAGAIEEAVGMLEEQQGLYDWPFQVEELLFKRSRRPDSLSLTLALLERLQAAPGLRPHQRVYAGIALAYAALQADDTCGCRSCAPGSNRWPHWARG